MPIDDEQARFNWIWAVRKKMALEMTGMNPEGRSRHTNQGFKKIRAGRPLYSLAESALLLDRILAAPDSGTGQPASHRSAPDRNKRRGRREEISGHRRGSKFRLLPARCVPP